MTNYRVTNSVASQNPTVIPFQLIATCDWLKSRAYSLAARIRHVYT